NKCGSDKWLYEEVTSLIQALEKDCDFLEESVFDLGLKVLGQNSENLVGATIGYYEIEGKLGEGGMGEVYVGRDTRLDRQVALKFLANPYLDDNWARRQMFKEARAAAMLDHPNICSVYGAEEIGSHRVIAMQYIRGETLSSLIRSKDLAPESVVPIARQIA